MAKTDEFLKKNFFPRRMAFFANQGQAKRPNKKWVRSKNGQHFIYQLFKTRNFVYRLNMHFLTKIVLIMGDVFFM